MTLVELLEAYGIKTEEDLDKAIRKLDTVDLAMFVEFDGGDESERSDI